MAAFTPLLSGDPFWVSSGGFGPTTALLPGVSSGSAWEVRVPLQQPGVFTVPNYDPSGFPLYLEFEYSFPNAAAPVAAPAAAEADFSAFFATSGSQPADEPVVTTSFPKSVLCVLQQDFPPGEPFLLGQFSPLPHPWFLALPEAVARIQKSSSTSRWNAASLKPRCHEQVFMFALTAVANRSSRPRLLYSSYGMSATAFTLWDGSKFFRPTIRNMLLVSIPWYCVF
jgi:hypothetical protein